mmetsp:Transcript_27781/g.84807  ORF Transcript_27781/g.84807 Transcript_27781/m.84807 type:complete len:93 (+) Transcript_27781:118-396(+)|eukprot:scaffold311523_cov35-Tisochrysis_lutea.AAC.2
MSPRAHIASDCQDKQTSAGSGWVRNSAKCIDSRGPRLACLANALLCSLSSPVQLSVMYHLARLNDIAAWATNASHTIACKAKRVGCEPKLLY